MTQPRSQLVDPTQAATFHGVNRCVRRSWRCGFDNYLGKSFEHRKSWVEARILELGQIFACGVHAWAVMSNHLHIVVHISPATASAWTSDEVALLKLAQLILPVPELQGRVKVLLCCALGAI